MTDSDTVRLCVHIIREHFGPITAKVASVLLTRGRLRLSQIIRFTGLKSRLVAQSVIIMIQHNILWHVENPNEGEMLEIGWEEVLVRLRFGRYIELAREVVGVEAEEVVSLILDHGKLRLSDILPTLVPDSDPKKLKLYTSTLSTLLQQSYIRPTSALSHISPRDRVLQYEAELKKGRRGLLSAKDLREIKESAEARLRREVEEEEESGMKRKAVDGVNARFGKRPKVESDAIDPTIFFRLNYSKFDIHLRNDMIETTVSQRFNTQASTIIHTTLSATLHRQQSLREEHTEPIPISHILQHLPANQKLTGISPAPSSNSASSIVKEYINIMCAADNPTTLGKASSFMSSQGSNGGNGGTKIQVEFEIIRRRLRLRVFEGVVREKWGDNGVKIVRILMDKGKMDEKHLAKIAMMAKNDVQPLLTAMSSASLISLQEVPRGTDRTASRTFYLWYIDLSKTYNVLLSQFYRTLGNILSRKASEYEKVFSLLEVPPSVRSRMEMEMIREWEEKKVRLEVLERRVEECVFVIRDLGVGLDRGGGE